MTPAYIQISHVDHSALLTLNRPQKHNAMHGPLVQELLSALNELAKEAIQTLIICGNGENFCAGADIAWMESITQASADENYQDAQHLADALYALYTFPKPTIVLAHGKVFGGGLGLLAAADIAIAAENAIFGLPEVTIGLTPSIVSPYMMKAIGERRANYYFLTGERFNVTKAYEMGLLHQVVEKEVLMQSGLNLAKIIAHNGRNAVSAAKHLIQFVSGIKITRDLSQKTAQHLAELRMTKEAQEGLHAFSEKREPQWKMKDE